MYTLYCWYVLCLLTTGILLPVSESFPFTHRREGINPQRWSGTVRFHRRDDAELLPLSSGDRKRMSAIRARQMAIPILFLDSMVPKQRLIFQSTDIKFRRLLEVCRDEQHNVIGMFGINPTTRKPLCIGVTLPVLESAIHFDPSTGSLKLNVTATRRIEVQGDPWVDDTHSFYMANVEILDGKEEAITAEQTAQAIRLSHTLPALVAEWKTYVLASGVTDQAGLDARCAMIGNMPSDENNLTDRAFWIAALINPLPSISVPVEIRPAMLCCSNDYYRMVLACQGLRSSIEHLKSRKRKL